MTPVSVEVSVQMEELINDDRITRSIAVSFPEIQRVLVQTALDAVDEGNVATIAPVLLGIKKAQDMLFYFKAKGDTLIQKEKQNARTK